MIKEFLFIDGPWHGRVVAVNSDNKDACIIDVRGVYYDMQTGTYKDCRGESFHYYPSEIDLLGCKQTVYAQKGISQGAIAAKIFDIAMSKSI